MMHMWLGLVGICICSIDKSKMGKLAHSSWNCPVVSQLVLVFH